MENRQSLLASSVGNQDKILIIKVSGAQVHKSKNIIRIKISNLILISLIRKAFKILIKIIKTIYLLKKIVKLA